MVIDQSEIQEFLQNHYLFKTLEPAILEKLVKCVGVIAFQPQKEIYHAGAPNNNFYFVFSGDLIAGKKATKNTQAETISLTDSDCFGYEALSETSLPYISSVITKRQSVLLILENKVISSLSREHSELKQIFQLLLRSFKLQQKKHFQWENSNELILYLTRRHISDLYTGLIAPTGVAILGYLVVLVLYNLLPKPTSPSIFYWSVLVASICVIWALYNVIDWSNDYYAFTNQRVLLLERVVLFYESRQETPLEAVQSIATSTELFGRMMTFGNISVRTYTGTINFPHIEAPQMIINLVEDYIHRIRTQHESEQNKRIEQTIRDRIRTGSSPLPTPTLAQEAENLSSQPSKKKEGFLVSLLRLKEITADTITYRTHWFILITKTIAPFLLFVFTLTALILRLKGYVPKVPVEIVSIIAAVLCLIAWGWWLYEFVDWRNDIYIITPDQVVDINRKPLGHEERRAAPLKNIQTIEYKRIGVFGLLFNFGTVFIRVGDTELTFDYVSDPSDVQRELFERFMQLSQQEKKARVEQENERMASWIEAYHRVTSNKVDQNDSPDRDQFSV
jgi:uncharacterized membrane protein YdbT with pleckstrin-like domain/CRP-like cAMP-binding protein